MTSPECTPEQQPLTSQYITDMTGHDLFASYDPDTFNHPWSRRALAEHAQRLKQAHGEDNVMTSFYEDPNGLPRLGLFARPIHQPKHARPEPQWTGELATRETVEIPVVDPDEAPPA